MELKIYSQSGILKMTVSPDDNSVQKKSVMGENTVNVFFTLSEAVLFDVNDYIDFAGERYTLPASVRPTQKSTLEFEYSLQFSGIESELSKALCFLLLDGEMDSDFALTEGPEAHMQLIVDNINRIKKTTAWRLGTIISAENKVITYEGTDCLSALNQIAQTFDTEWWIEGTTIHLCRCEHGETIELGYGGDGSGVTGLTKLRKQNGENADFFTRLYAKGSTRNIKKSSYGSENLHLPSPLKYLEKNTEYGVIEREVIFEEVYPRRVGTITEVRSAEQTTDGKTITVYYFKDNGLNFNPNDYEIENLTKHIKFETGELSGYDFEANYNATTGEFELINQYPGEGIQLPGGAMIPAVENTYVLYNVRMPEEYIPLAEKELQQVATSYLDKNSIDGSIYSGDSDPIDFEKRGISVSLGRRVKLHSDVYFTAGYRDSRITGFTRNLNNPQQITLDVSDAVSVGRLEALERKVNAILPEVRKGSTLEIIESTEPVDKATEKNLFSALASLVHFLRKDAPDQTSHLLKLLGGAITDNLSSQAFTEGALGSGFTIRRDPETGKSYIEVDELFVRMKAIFKELVIQKLSHVGGEIILSPASMKCVRVEDLVDRYRCYFEKTDGDREINNEFVVNDQARCQTFNVKVGINHNVSNSYYWRLVIGTGDDFVDLSKTDCDTGSTVPTSGDDIVQLGNRTDTDRQSAIILSAYGSNAPSFTQYNGINSYSLAGKEINMIGKDSRFAGKVTIGAGSAGLGNLDEWPDAEDAINEANKKGDDAIGKAQSAQDYIDITLPVELRNLQDQIDGQVQAFFEGYNPTPANYPASEWTTDEIRATHGNDTFTNTLNGSSWRWSKVGNTWQWVEIIDAEVKEALRLAGLAKDTADGKRRVFITTPYTPYDSGDLWTQGSSGDVMRCIKSRTTGVYEPADWDKASKYTDDTAANKAQELADALNARVNDIASDNKLTGVEKQSVKKEWDIIESEYPTVITQATAFNVSTDTFRQAYYNLINYLNVVMRSPGEPILTMSGENLTTVSGELIYTMGSINLETTNDINGNYFRTVFKNYSDAKLGIDKAISNILDASTKDNKKEILEVNKALGLFQDDVNGAFKDGIISKAEVDVIASHINTLNVEKKDVDASYSKIMENVYLSGTAKTNLSVYKGVYDVAHDNLITSINTAIADGQATREEQVDVNNKFVAYGNALAGYQTKLVEANKAIQDKLKEYSDNAQDTANSADAKATELQGRVNDMSSDNKLTGIEKQATKKDWDIINSEFPYLVDQAGKYQINTDAYRQSYYNLSNYLNIVMRAQGEPIVTMSGENLTTVSGELIYTMGSINLEATVNINGNTFRSMFQDYNNSRVILSKAITDKAKELADKAQSDANKAQADADKVIKEVSDIVSDNILTPPEKQSLKQQLSIITSEQLTLIGQANKYGIPTKPLNDSYTTLSNYMAKFFVDMTINQIANGNEVRLLYKNYYVAKTNLLKSITDKGKDETDKKPSTFINPIATPPTGAKDGDIWIPSDQSVVFGYVGGNWVLKGDNTQTVVDKGLVTAGTVAVSSDPALGLEKAKAGMTAAGTGDSAVRFWAGSEKNNNANAPYMVLEGGKLISKDAEITGTVKANKGEIGEYYIAEGGLRWSNNSTSKSISFSPNMFTSNLPGPAGGAYNVFLHLKMPLSNAYNRPIFVEGCSEFYGQMVVSGSIMTRGFQMNITDSTVNLTSSRYLFENDILGLSNKNDILVHCITQGLRLYLPKIATINAMTDLTTFNSWTMRLTIVGKKTSTQSFYVEGGTDATILDNNAQVTQPVILAAGDVLEFLLYHDKGASTYRAQVLNYRTE